VSARDRASTIARSVRERHEIGAPVDAASASASRTTAHPVPAWCEGRERAFLQEEHRA